MAHPRRQQEYECRFVYGSHNGEYNLKNEGWKSLNRFVFMYTIQTLDLVERLIEMLVVTMVINHLCGSISLQLYWSAFVRHRMLMPLEMK